MKNAQISKLVTVTRQDLTAGEQLAQSCHSVADFSYYQPKIFKDWREQSNYKICLATKDEQSLIKLHDKLISKGATIVAFIEPDMQDQMTAFTFYGTPEIRKYTTHLPLAGKQFGSATNRVVGGSLPSTPTIYGNSSEAEHSILDRSVVGSIPTSHAKINVQQ